MTFIVSCPEWREVKAVWPWFCALKGRLEFGHFEDDFQALARMVPTKECILSRRDQTKVAWHEVPGNKRIVDPSRRDG